MVKAPEITLTPAAVNRVKMLAENAATPMLGLRIGIKNGGCSGMAYEISYAQAENKEDIRIEQDGAVVFLDVKASVFLIGAVMDYVEEDLYSGFKFTNPNIKGECGCGESFMV